jgi:hypothetical protein
MRTWADSTLMSMKKSDLIECLRCAEHNQAVAEEQLAQHIENVKDWVPVVRCKDCDAWKRNVGIVDSPNGHCFKHDIDTNGQDFCSWGATE